MHTSPRGTGQPLEPVASTSFYGESQRPVARQPLRAISQSQRHSTDTSVAMDVDSQEKAAASVGINLDDDDTQFPNSPASMDELNEDTMINYPSVGTMQLQGHGYLPNAILGHSDHAGFQLGAAFGWPASFDAAALVDFNIDLKYSYVGRPTPSKASPNDITVTPSPAIRSYSQAASTAASSSASPAPASASTNTAAGHSPVRQSSAGGSLATPQRESSSSSSATRFTTASIEKARPHPHAYYNIASQAWTVITAIPQDRTNSQIQSSISGQCMINNHETRKTHHYVRVPKGIDPRFILRPSETNIGSSDQPMQSHGSEPPLGGPSSAPFPDPSDPTHACWSGPASSAASCWDMYVCSGCRNAFTVSPPDVIPSILGREACRSFVESRLAEEGPRSGQVNDLSVIAFAMEYMWK